MDLYEVFSSPFKLIECNVFHQPIPKMKAEYKTSDIFGETTKEEIFILSKMYFDQLILEYKNYIIDDQQTTESSYVLSVGLIEEDELKFKHIYSCFYNNVEDKISWENKYDDNFNIEGDFFVYIDVAAMVIPDYDSNDEDVYDNIVKKTITESECIICFEKTPNMLYTDCMHLCVCNECDRKGKFTKCPMCRTKIKNNKIRIT